MTTPQPGWYDDPDDSNAQRYWDGQTWPPHRQRKPVTRPASPPPPPELPPRPPAFVVEYPPPAASDLEYRTPAPGGPPQRSGTSTAIIAVIGLIAVLAVAGFSVYKFALEHHSSSAPTSSETNTPTSLETDAPTHSAPRASRHSTPRGLTHSAPDAPTGGGETKFLNDLSAAGITSSTATPEALVARGQQVCSDLAAGKSQDAAAADIVSSSNGFFDKSSAKTIVRVAIKDLCPQ